jgi:uncharacterized protein YoaH (UPF0181 family)
MPLGILRTLGWLMDRNQQNKTARAMVWITDPAFQGWICSRCEWNFPLPTLLSDPQAKTAYDRLAAGKFREHACESFLSRLQVADSDSFTARIRKLVGQGFKPKDAVDIVLQEVMLEHHNDAKLLEQARTEGEDFLRRVREGLM